MNAGSHHGDKANVAIIQGEQANPEENRNTHCSREAQDSGGPLVCKENRVTQAKAPRGRNLLSLKLRHTLYTPGCPSTWAKNSIILSHSM